MSTSPRRSFFAAEAVRATLWGSLARLVPSVEPKAPAELHPIGFCSVHGVFPATALRDWFQPPAVALSKLLVTCPTCERGCVILPVPYEPADERLNSLVHPSTSSDSLRALSVILLASREGALSPQEVETQARQFAPDMAGIVDFLNSTADFKLALSVAIDTIVALREGTSIS
jgi:hypothetical protein